MDGLIVKKLRGEATDLELRRLERWRSESPDNDRAYDEFVRLWSGTGEPELPAVGPPPALERIIREGDARSARSRLRRSWLVPERWRGPAFGLAAAAVAVAVFLTLPWRSDRDPTRHGLFPVESSSSGGDITTLGLSDGSIVRTMPETRLEFPFAEDRREVVLEGKAFFAVVEDPVPFVVRTALGEVTVYGTRFEILTSRAELRLVVVEGRVRFEGEDGVEFVDAGQVAHVGRGSPPRIVDHTDPWSLLDWTGGLLIFEATPLATVATELSRHFGRDVTIRDEALAQLRITAWFEDEPIEEVVAAICLVALADCEVSDSGVRIGRQVR